MSEKDEPIPWPDSMYGESTIHRENRVWTEGLHLRPELITVQQPGSASSPVVLVGCALDGGSPSTMTKSLPATLTCSSQAWHQACTTQTNPAQWFEDQADAKHLFALSTVLESAISAAHCSVYIRPILPIDVAGFR